MEQIKIFCENPNIEDLKELDAYSSILLVDTCLKIHEGDLGLISKLKIPNIQKFVRMILKHFKIHRSPPKSSIYREEAENYLENFSVAVTGARAGDTLVGTSNVSRGAVIRIHYDDVLPNRETIEGIGSHEIVFKKTIEGMKVFDKFKNYSDAEIRDFLFKYGNPKKAFLGEDSEKIRIELIQPGESNFAKHVSKENLEKLMSGQTFSLQEIEEMFPRKPGSRALHPTLMFIKHWWKVVIEYKSALTFAGTCLDLYTGKVMGNFQGKEKKRVIILENLHCISSGTLGFISNASPKEINREYVKGIVSEMVQVTEEEYEAVRRNFKNFAPSAYKSLLQKIIRFRAKNVRLDNGKMMVSEKVLLVTLSELLLHPGAFVPDIQRFVTGIESMVKRLAVTIFEDSFFDRKEDAVILLGAALLAQKYKNYKPSRILIKRWFEIALKGLSSSRVHFWKIDQKLADYEISSENSAYENSSAILDEIRSFQSDLNMVSYLAYEKVKFTPPKNIATPQAEYMPICHGTDFHCAPDIAYYFDLGIPLFEGNSLGAFYRKIFRSVSGVNPRRKYLENYDSFEEVAFVKEVRKAQLRYLCMKQTELIPRGEIGGKYSMKETLHEGWLAGLVGVIEIRNFYVTLRYDDIYNLSVAKKPTRDIKDSYISPEDYERAISEAREKLEMGIDLNQAALPSEDFRNCKVVLSEGEYYIEKDDILFPWEEFRKIKVIVPFHTEVSDKWECLRYKGTGLVKGAFDKLASLLENENINTLKRVLMYISSYDTEIELNHLNIKGEALHLSVNEYDLKAFHFMLQLSSLFPGAFSPTQYSAAKFKVYTPILLWRVRKKIISNVKSREILDVSGWQGNKFLDKRKRQPWEHQVSALQEMKENYLLGTQGHFIWIPVGMGKSLLVMTYLASLFKDGQLPPYIVYSLPSSAIQSVVEEIRSFGLKVNLHIPLKNISKRKIPSGVTVKQNGDFEPFVVSMIEHDHLRRVKEELVGISGQSIVIIDEVHKTLNDTQRTSIAVEVSYLSQQFVAMTGTPVIDNKIYKLLAWLKQIVPFELNEKNFWVAVNSMVSRKVNTGVLVERKDELAFFTQKEEKEYQNLVSPSIGGFNKNVTQEDIREAIEICYKTSTRKMIKKVEDLVENKNGVMVVARNREHQLELYEKIGEKIGEKNIYLIEKGGSIFLTDESVQTKVTPDYKVVITTIRQSEGYTLTRLNTFVTGVYFSNNAVREQLEGRINRIGQKAKKVEYFYVHCGVLTYIHRKYKDVKSLAMALESLVEDI